MKKNKDHGIQFLLNLSENSNTNLTNLICSAKLLKSICEDWDHDIWEIVEEKIKNQTGRNVITATLAFMISTKLVNNEDKTSIRTHAGDDYGECVKSLVMLRYETAGQSLSNQRQFVSAFGYISFVAKKYNCSIFDIDRRVVDESCELLAENYESTTVYNMYKHVHEICGHLFKNKICRHLGNYHCRNFKRPKNVSGVGYKRLDDKSATEVSHHKAVPPGVYMVIAELYKNIPKDNQFRVMVLFLVFITLTGRRFSEVSDLPFQQLNADNTGNYFINYFPKKHSFGRTEVRLERFYLPSSIVPILTDVINECIELTSNLRLIAKNMRIFNGPDLSLLKNLDKDKLYFNDLLPILSSNNASLKRFLKKSIYTSYDDNFIPYITVESLREYIMLDFKTEIFKPFFIDSSNKKYYLEDFLFLKYNKYNHQFKKTAVNIITHSSFDAFINKGKFENLVKKICTIEIEKFASHNFRHSLNTMLEDGGLSTMLQTEWFGRRNPEDTKAYQHVTPEQKALEIRLSLIEGELNGNVVQQLSHIPVNSKEAFLNSRIKVAHDLGTGYCIRDFSQLPCAKHLECTASCNDYAWINNDTDKLKEIKRKYAFAMRQKAHSDARIKGSTAEKNISWVAHNEKVINTLVAQLKTYNIDEDFLTTGWSKMYEEDI